MAVGHPRSRIFTPRISSGDYAGVRANLPPPEVQVKAGFTARVVSWPWQASYYTALEIVVGGRTNKIWRRSMPDGFVTDPIIVAGPAIMRLLGDEAGLCTIEVIPDSFPPDKTLVIPEGTGARLALECSTNLLTWAEVWTQAYTNVPSSMFFRIKAERMP